MSAPPPLRPVVLCGGAGTRLWPLSRPDRPKPLLSLVTDDTLLHDTLARCRPLGEPWLVCGAAHEESIARAAPGVPRLVEPAPRGTAPAAVAAALLARRDHPDALVLLAPADHAVAPDEAFRASVARGAALAAEGFLVTFGVPARGPSEHYGWIRPGDVVGEGHRIEGFVEKPSRAESAALWRSGCLWNSGLFLFRADRLLDEVRERDAALVDAVERALPDPSGEAWRLGPSFAEAAAVSLDVLVMQSTPRGAVVPATFRWADMGTWPAVIEARGGRSGSLVLSDGPEVRLLGDPGVLVAVTGGAVLVATPEAAGDLGASRPAGPACLDSGPGWRLERRFVAAGEVHAGPGTVVLLAGAARCGDRGFGPGDPLPVGAVATSVGTWLTVVVEG